MKSNSFLSRLQNAAFGVRAGVTFFLLIFGSLLMDVAPWVDTAFQRFFVGLGFPPAEAAFLSGLGV